MKETFSQEIKEELKKMYQQHKRAFDVIIPPVIFIVCNQLLGLLLAGVVAGGLSLITVVFRLQKKENFWFAVGGLLSTSLAIILAIDTGEARGFFIPGIIGDIAITFCALISIVVKKPLAAWISFFTHRWPLGWYWHPLVRPAYTSVTWVWLLFFAGKSAIESTLFILEDIFILTGVQVVFNWPGLIALLIASYALGRHQLKKLQGPGVEEFKKGSPRPWRGQEKSF